VGEVQRTLGGVGFVSKVGRTRTWTLAQPGARPHARAVSIFATIQQGKTVLRAEESLSQLAGALFGGIVGGAGGGTTGLWMAIGMGAMHSPVAAVGLVLMGLVGSYSLARSLFVRAYRKRSEELQDLLSRRQSWLRGAAEHVSRGPAEHVSRGAAEHVSRGAAENAECSCFDQAIIRQ
jgi:hypothetical protein